MLFDTIEKEFQHYADETGEVSGQRDMSVSKSAFFAAYLCCMSHIREAMESDEPPREIVEFIKQRSEEIREFAAIKIAIDRNRN